MTFMGLGPRAWAGTRLDPCTPSPIPKAQAGSVLGAGGPVLTPQAINTSAKQALGAGGCSQPSGSERQR